MRLPNRVWTWAADNLVTQGRMADLLKAPSLVSQEQVSNRLAAYAERWAYYENKDLYRRLYHAGMRPHAMPVEWNPIPAVISFYITNTLGSKLDIQPSEDTLDEEALTAAITQVWQWSNFEQLKRDLSETASVLGDTFIKVAEKRPKTGDQLSTAVYLQSIPPEQVVWWNYDERDFLTGIRIDTPRVDSIFTGEKRKHTLVEVWQKDFGDGTGGVRRYETLNSRFTEDERLGDPEEELTFDELGYDFIPIVWSSVTMPWWHVTDQIDEVNAMGRVMRQLNRPVALIHGKHTDPDGRPVPAPKVRMDDLETRFTEAADGTFAYVSIPGQAQFDWARSPIDMGAAAMQQSQIRKGVETALPEYRVAELDPSQIAASTLEMLLDQAGQRVASLRDTLERGLSRAQMMALTVGQLRSFSGFSEFDIGVYSDGDLEHSFVERGVFQPTATVQALVYKELRAADLPPRLAMKKAGFSEAEIDEYEDAFIEDSIQKETTLAATLVRQQALLDSGGAGNGVA